MSRQFRLLSLLPLLGALASTAGAQLPQVRQHRSTNEHAILSEYFELLAIPNVASDSAGIARNADFIVRMLDKRGLSPKKLTGANSKAPALIYGEWKVPGATRTIVLYAHYDGQPTDSAKWTGSAPWRPVLRTAALENGGRIIPMPPAGTRFDPESRIYARSASDDKAGVMAIVAAIDALRAARINPTVNVKLVFDGE